MSDQQYKQFNPKPDSAPKKAAYSRVLLKDGDSLIVFGAHEHNFIFELSVSRCNSEWMYWLDTGLIGFGVLIVPGETRKLSVNPDRPEDHVLLCFEMFTEQTVSIRAGQSQGAGVGMMIKRVERPTPRLN